MCKGARESSIPSSQSGRDSTIITDGNVACGSSVRDSLSREVQGLVVGRVEAGPLVVVLHQDSDVHQVSAEEPLHH